MDKKLTICFFGEAKPEDIHTVKWAKFFSDKGHKVHLFSYSDFGANRVPEMELHLLKKKYENANWFVNTFINLPLTVLRIRKEIKKINPDIVHGHCITSYGTLASLVNFRPLILTAWGSDILINPKKNFITKLATRFALKKADLITCDAEHMKRAIMDFGVKDDKIKIVYFGVDTKKFSPGEKNKELADKFNINGKKVVISLRNLEPIYNIETLILASKDVLKVCPDAKFLIAGKGTEENKLKEMAKPFKDNIEFIGWIPAKELFEYLRLGDIYVSTSLSDGGIASSTAEAMACGLPVVITDTGENNKWIKDNEDGYLIPARDYSELAKKIIKLLKDDNLRKAFGQRSRKIIMDKNDYYGEMTRMENMCFELIKKYGIQNM